MDLGLQCDPTESNMVLFHHEEAPAIAKALGEAGVKFLPVRDVMSNVEYALKTP